MERIANQNAREYVQRNEPFQGSNMFGVFDDDDQGSNTPYVVYSYGYHFPMFIFINGHWYENSDKYSRSTSKQQSQARPTMKTIKLNIRSRYFSNINWSGDIFYFLNF